MNDENGLCRRRRRLESSLFRRRQKRLFDATNEVVEEVDNAELFEAGELEPCQAYRPPELFTPGRVDHHGVGQHHGGHEGQARAHFHSQDNGLHCVRLERVQAFD